MKITRRQLRQIIKEAGGYRDYSDDEVEYTSRAGTLYDELPGLGPRDDHLENISSQDMADAKRHAGDDPKAQADYLDISVEDWNRIRQETDDWYEERHILDQMEMVDDKFIDWSRDLAKALKYRSVEDMPADMTSDSYGGPYDAWDRGVSPADYAASAYSPGLDKTSSGGRHPLDVDGDGKLTISEMKITRRQLRRIIREAAEI